MTRTGFISLRKCIYDNDNDGERVDGFFKSLDVVEKKSFTRALTKILSSWSPTGVVLRTEIKVWWQRQPGDKLNVEKIMKE